MSDDRERRAVWVVCVAALLIVVVFFLFLVLNWYISPTKPSGRKDLILAVAQILGGTALLSGLYFTWRTLQVNREGQITERFTRAIDQLGKTDENGNKLFEIRLGGIYALERIARESEEDHWPIMEILTAYVRQHSPWPPEEEDKQGEQDATVHEKESEESPEEAPETTKVPTINPEIKAYIRAVDIRAIMTVLRRRTRYYEHGEPEPLNLSMTNLRSANLTEANLQGANFFRANLQGANFFKANLKGARLIAAILTGNFQGAILAGADLDSADLRGADLKGADLKGARLRGARLVEYIGPYTLDRANLDSADLRGADLWAADVRGVDLRTARNLVQEQIELAKGDGRTRLPEHLEPPARWGVKTDEQPEED